MFTQKARFFVSSIVDEIERTLPKSEADIPETEVVQADRDLESTATDIVQSAIHDAGVKYSERVTDKDTLDVSSVTQACYIGFAGYGNGPIVVKEFYLE